MLQVKIADTITMLAVNVPPAARRTVLVDMLTVHGKGSRAIVFTQTKREADDVAAALGRSMSCEALHGDIAQWQREKTLQVCVPACACVCVRTPELSLTSLSSLPSTTSAPRSSCHGAIQRDVAF